MNWYYADKGSQVGPVSEEEFQSLVQKGTITSDTLVWNSNMKDWQKYGDVMGGKIAEPTSPTAQTNSSEDTFCAECGKPFSKEDMIRYQDSWVCAICKPIFVQKLKEGVTLATSLEYAGFWIRFGAKIIDGIIMWVITMIVSMAFVFMAGSFSNSTLGIFVSLISFFFQIAIPAAYTTWFLGKYGATLGKMACKIKVVSPDGYPISYLRALGRHFAEWLSGMILMIGYIMAAFDDEKRALHDRICETRVVKK